MKKTLQNKTIEYVTRSNWFVHDLVEILISQRRQGDNKVIIFLQKQFFEAILISLQIVIIPSSFLLHWVWPVSFDFYIIWQLTPFQTVPLMLRYIGLWMEKLRKWENPKKQIYVTGALAAAPQQTAEKVLFFAILQIFISSL